MCNIIDNSASVLPMLKFEEGYMYNLVVLVRKKDGENKKSTSLIREYYIDSKGYFDRKYPEILGLVDYFKGRAYVSTRRIDKSKLGLSIIKATVHKIESGDNSFTKIVGNAVGASFDKCDPKKWLFDIDSTDYSVFENTKDILSNLCNVNIISQYRTKNGFHIFTNSFDTRGINLHPSVELKKGGCALIAFSN